jgi:hypothetical protein
MLRWGLNLACRLTDAPVPDSLVKVMDRDAMVQRLTQETMDHLWTNSNQGKWFRRSFSQVRMMDGWPGQLRSGFGNLLNLVNPTHREWEMLPLPDAMFPLYYAIRPVRLTGKYSMKFLKGAFS